MQSIDTESTKGPAGNSSKIRLTLGRYVKRQNGVPLGASGSLSNMLIRAFGARGFDRFWTHWNPIFSFYLGKYIFHPVSQVMPVPMALVITFTANGLLHDAVTMAVRHEPAWFFTPWFLIMGVMAAIHRRVPLRYASPPFVVRALINTLHIGVALIFPLWLHLI